MGLQMRMGVLVACAGAIGQEGEDNAGVGLFDYGCVRACMRVYVCTRRGGDVRAEL